MRAGEQSCEGLVVRSAVFSSQWISGFPWLSLKGHCQGCPGSPLCTECFWKLISLWIILLIWQWEGSWTTLTLKLFWEASPLPTGASLVPCDSSGCPAEEFGGVSGALLRLQGADTKLKVPECAQEKFWHTTLSQPEPSHRPLYAFIIQNWSMKDSIKVLYIYI